MVRIQVPEVCGQTARLSDELQRFFRMDSHFLGLEGQVRTCGFENHPLLNSGAAHEQFLGFLREDEGRLETLPDLLDALACAPELEFEHLPAFLKVAVLGQEHLVRHEITQSQREEVAHEHLKQLFDVVNRASIAWWLMQVAEAQGELDKSSQYAKKLYILADSADLRHYRAKAERHMLQGNP